MVTKESWGVHVLCHSPQLLPLPFINTSYSKQGYGNSRPLHTII